MMKTSMVLFAEFVNRPKQRAPHSTQEVFGSQKFQNWKKATERMSPASHIETESSCAATTEGGYARKRELSCKEISCTLHSLSYQAPYCSLYQFHQLVDLVVSCGVRELQVFVENASRNAVYTSQGAEVDFIEALGTWVKEVYFLKRLQKASVFSVMADECSVITAVEELSVFCHWEEDGTPVECFLDIVPLKKADAESKYLALVKRECVMVLPPFLVKDWCSSMTKETCSTCSICLLSPPAISMHASCQ